MHRFALLVLLAAPALAGELPLSEGFSFQSLTDPADPVFADFDGDGDLDVASVERSGGFVLVNLTNGNFSTLVSFTPVQSSSLSLVAGDIDQDGDVDLMSGGVGASGFWFLENDGTGTSWTTHSIFGLVDQTGMALADFDRDGSLDVVYS